MDMRIPGYQDTPKPKGAIPHRVLRLSSYGHADSWIPLPGERESTRPRVFVHPAAPNSKK